MTFTLPFKTHIDIFAIIVTFILAFLQGSTDAIAFLILTYHASIKDNLPYYLTSQQSSLVLALAPRSRIYRQFYSDVLHLWKENQLASFPQFEIVEGKNTEYTPFHKPRQLVIHSISVSWLS